LASGMAIGNIGKILVVD